jgi:glycogen phosphorylase
MAMLTARFSSNRAVRECTEDYYLPAAEAYRHRSAQNAAVGKQIAQWQTRLRSHWSDLRFGRVDIDSGEGFHAFHAEVFVGGLQPEDVRVEIYAEPQSDAAQANWSMARGKAVNGKEPGHLYHGQVPGDRPASDYTLRIVPQYSGVVVPLEAPMILWQPRD